jgi:hypothetical protein
MELEGSEHTISAESIYRHVYSPNGRRAGLPRLLAQRKPKRGRRRRNGRREPSIPNRMPIHQRPIKAHLRSQFGHWEGDLMHFRRQRDILLTLHERRSRLTLARRLLTKMPMVQPKPSLRNWAGCAPARAAPSLTTTAASSPGTRALQRRSGCPPISAIRTARGSAAQSRTLTGVFVATFPVRPALKGIPMPTSTT